ncbi:hypothetical protein [Nocardioides sp.]|uniref:hypothetical protein n=1 Tax=Nocardioides sp. TaxID=35761 RepID=UPI0027325B48|nr:hypothetical protein [Nocardioides sp.]MDP3893036.1 hypothetical protein [Nocardioides sp.]
MTSRSIRRFVFAGALCLVPALLAPVPASSYPYTIQVTQTAPVKTKAKYYREYHNPGTGKTVDSSDFDAGRVRVEATPFRIKEGMKKFDQYLLRLIITTPGQKTGGDNRGWANIYVEPRKTGKISHSSATADRKVNKKCAAVDISLNASFGPIGLGTSVGKLRGCRHAFLDLQSHNRATGATSWKVRKLKHFKRVNAEIYLQVPKGKKPNYRITLTTPIDTCTHSKGMLPYECQPKDLESSITFRVKGSS